METLRVQEALRAGFDEHYRSLLRLCVLLSGERDVAEDIVQDAFVRVAAHITTLEADQVGPYLRKTVVNLWKNRVRGLVIERRFRTSVAAPSGGEGSGVEEREVMWQAVKRLPDRQRACVVLRFYEGLHEREVADVLGCSLGSVKKHTSRALARLREEFRDED